MKISNLSIGSLIAVVLGDDNTPSSRGGPKIVELFNLVGFNEEYWDLSKKGLFGARKDFTKRKLEEINGTNKLVFLIELLVDDRQTQKSDEVAKKLNNILKHDKYHLIKNKEGIYKLSGFNLPEDAMVKPVFELIEKEIIGHILASKYAVWVAVAWITSKPIATALYRQHQKGVNIRIIVNDDEITNSKGITFENTQIEYYKIQQQNGAFNNLMHHKFCIIDFKKVITGSFNWTIKASFNNENITVIEQKEQAEKFADEFIKLIKDFQRS
ncbi:phospholipase D-like domain-containing protein [Acinetobacter sp. ANC 5414]|uniref:phospholipase D-like domain-containing protein n=1 Tax=Acinetobacter sp. ANC 5414 TaxID=2731251 RepID=UPI00148F8973|nr:phospholipase D-like domain-containing protein [Acinetobacter sp. ANC 5414]NNH01486.1 DUF1669 domain-containing protein [Acinetobacter sp. ANC 5414]